LKAPSYVASLSHSALIEVQESAKALHDHVATFNKLEWQELLWDLCGGSSAPRNLFPSRREETLQSFAALMRDVSDHTHSLIGSALSAVISKSLSESSWSTTDNALYLAYSLRLRVQAHQLREIAGDGSFASSTRRAALAALSISDSSPEYWASIETDDCPELTLVVARQVARTDPLRALAVLASVSRGVEQLSMQRACEHVLSLISPSASGLVFETVANATPLVRPILRTLLETSSAVGRFGLAKPTLTLVKSRALTKLVENIQKRDWIAWHRYSGYYERKLLHDPIPTQLPAPIRRFVAAQLTLLAEHATETMGLEDGYRISLAASPTAMLDSLVDEVQQLKILQTDPIFASAKRLRWGSFLAIGTIRRLWLLIPAKHAPFIRSSIAPALKASQAVRLSRVLEFCLQNGYKCLSQPSTAIAEELAELLDARVQRGGAPTLTSNPFDQLNTAERFADEFIRAAEKGRPANRTNFVALVDHLVLSDIRAFPGTSKAVVALPVEYDRALPVGYLIPDNDIAYQDFLQAAARAFLKGDGNWKRDLESLMKGAKVDLFEGGPKVVSVASLERQDVTKRVPFATREA
jgi:hypothetical protein